METSKEYRIQFAQLMEALRSAYPRYNFIDDQYSKALWAKSLSDIPIDKLSIAVESFILSSKWPPTIADLREMALKTEQDETNWSYGWGLVNKAIGRFGQYREHDAMLWIASQDKIAVESIRRVGFKDLCNSTEEEKGFFRTTFSKVYDSIKAEEKFYNQLSNEVKEKISLSRAKEKSLELGIGNAEKINEMFDAIGSGTINNIIDEELLK